MQNKQNTRIGTRADTGATPVNNRGKDTPLPDFPKRMPEKRDLNTSAPTGKSTGGNVTTPTKPPGNKSGGIVPKILQVKRYLEERYQFRYNTVKNAVEFAPVGSNEWSDVDERTANGLEAELLYANFNGIQRILSVLLSTSEHYDPIRAYLEALPGWDGQTDHIEALANFVQVEPIRRTWFNGMLKKHLVRALACATGQIAFNKQIFVLVSGQNDGKTSFLRYLCPPAWSEYYTEDIDFENKDGLIALARNVFINLDELRNLSRQDITKVKSFISKDNIKARLPFDKRETKLKRNASFFGSTNNAEFLTDETGNVRWLVFEIQGINHDNGGQNGYCQIDINQVWAQAYALLKQGFQCQLTREEIQKSETYNKAHTKFPIERDLILEHFDFSEDKADWKSTAKILDYLQARTSAKLVDRNIGIAMNSLQRKRVGKNIAGGTMYGYLVREVEKRNWDND